jgi:3-oxoacyl-[acyl-carrier protein] reductase
MRKLQGKVAIVTGASKGIGTSIATHLAAEGAAVVVNYATSKAGADRVVSAIATRDGKAMAVQANVANEAEIERLFAATEHAFGRLDMLVNNAAILAFRPREGITEEHVYTQCNANLLGPILAIQRAVQHFGSAGGSLINMSAAASSGPQPGRCRLQRVKGRLGEPHACVCQRTRPTQDSGACHASRTGGDGGGVRRWPDGEP